MPASVMTMPEATKALQLYEAGYSQPQIAAEIGRSRKAVRTAFRQLGVQPRSSTDGYRAWLRLRGGRGNRARIQQ
jgi:biotin operon repressor